MSVAKHRQQRNCPSNPPHSPTIRHDPLQHAQQQPNRTKLPLGSRGESAEQLDPLLQLRQVGHIYAISRQ